MNNKDQSSPLAHLTQALPSNLTSRVTIYKPNALHLQTYLQSRAVQSWKSALPQSEKFGLGHRTKPN